MSGGSEATVAAGGLVLAYASGYWWLAARRLREKGRISRGRAVAWALGLSLVLVALASPLDHAAHDSIVAHMVQHELLVALAPVLLLLGIDGQLFAPVTRTAFRPLLRRRRTRALLALAASPYTALSVYGAAVLGWHIPGAYRAALESGVAHGAEHATLLAAGSLFWFQLIRPLPSVTPLPASARLAYLAAGMVVSAVVGAVLIWSPEPLYGAYAGPPDQALAGAIMLGFEMPLGLAVATWVVLTRWPTPIGDPR